MNASLQFLGGKRSELERELVGLTAARHRVAGLDVLGKRDDLVALRAAHAIREGRRPAIVLLSNAEGMTGAVRALHEISGSDSNG